MDNTGYLLTNLGTPDSPDVADVRQYLGEFLMDPYVLDVPYPIRRLIVSAFILPFRPKKSAEAYASIWDKSGSPLLKISQEQLSAVSAELKAPVALGMRYGQPSLAQGVDSLVEQGVDNLVVIPLYPQYADSTVTTSIDAVNQHLPDGVTARFITAFYDDPRYISALASSVKQTLPATWDHLLMSYHGLPTRHLKKADPTGKHCMQRADCCAVASTAHATCYRHQVFETSRALAHELELSESQYSVTFQSRLGGGWLQPYTDQVLAELPNQGVKHLAVVCPAFVADNLETLEEMGLQGRETFLEAGGETFHLIPCLNDHPDWINALVQILNDDSDAG